MQAILWTVWRGKHCDTFQIRGRCDSEDHRKTDCRAVRGQDAEAGSIFDSAEAAGAVKPPENKQIEREEEIAKRSRYYHTSMARQGLKKGQPYRMLKSNYVIFVCCYDAFDMDRIMTLEEEMIIRYDSGLQKGRAEGQAEGAALKQREIAQNLKNAGIPIPVIAETTGLTQEEVEML